MAGHTGQVLVTEGGASVGGAQADGDTPLDTVVTRSPESDDDEARRPYAVVLAILLIVLTVVGSECLARRRAASGPSGQPAPVVREAAPGASPLR